MIALISYYGIVVKLEHFMAHLLSNVLLNASIVWRCICCRIYRYVAAPNLYIFHKIEGLV